MRPQTHLGIESMCGLGQVSRAGFYRHWQQNEPHVEETELRGCTRSWSPTGATTATGG
jgi:hypothetical protein